VVVDRRGEEKTKECPTGATNGEVVEEAIREANNTIAKKDNNCPSCVRGESNAVAEGDRSSILPIGTSGKHILVETSYYNAPIKMRETLQQIKSLGYHPLLAHPERYMYLDNAEYTRLHSEGVRFQLNLASLAGGYGPVVKKKALWLLANGLYSVAGSDLHCEDAIEYITNCKLSKQAIEQVNSLLTNRL
jgi:tyrosine-protein phosphatase YwqE